MILAADGGDLAAAAVLAAVDEVTALVHAIGEILDGRFSGGAEVAAQSFAIVGFCDQRAAGLERRDVVKIGFDGRGRFSNLWF